MSELGQAIIRFEKAIDKFGNSLNRIEEDENPIIETICLDIKHELEELKDALNDFVEERDPNIIEDLLDEKRLFWECDVLTNRYTKHILGWNSYILKKISRIDKDCRNNIIEISDRISYILDEISEIFLNFRVYLDVNRTSVENFILVLKDNFRAFCKDYRNHDFKVLKRVAMEYKPYPGAKLTDEVWGNVLKYQFEAIDLAVRNSLVETNERQYYIYDKERLQSEYELLNKLQESLDDESLYDFDYAAQPHINIYRYVTYDNIDLFFTLLLQHNLIICEMNSGEKQKFEAWLNPSKIGQSENVVQNNEIDYNDILMRFVLDDNERAKVVRGLQTCKDTKEVSTLAKTIYEDEILSYETLRSVEFHRAIIPILSFHTTEKALKQAIAKQVK